MLENSEMFALSTNVPMCFSRFTVVGWLRDCFYGLGGGWWVAWGVT